MIIQGSSHIASMGGMDREGEGSCIDLFLSTKLEKKLSGGRV